MVLEVAVMVGTKRLWLILSEEVRLDLLEPLMALPDVELVGSGLTVLLPLLLVVDEVNLGTLCIELLDDLDAGRLELLDDLKTGQVELLDDLNVGRDELLDLLDAGRVELVDDLDTGRLELLDDFTVKDVLLMDDVVLIGELLREDVVLRVEVDLGFVDDDFFEDDVALPSVHLQRSSSRAAVYFGKGEVVLGLMDGQLDSRYSL